MQTVDSNAVIELLAFRVRRPLQKGQGRQETELYETLG